jgi:hypothetical protein
MSARLIEYFCQIVRANGINKDIDRYTPVLSAYLLEGGPIR